MLVRLLEAECFSDDEVVVVSLMSRGDLSGLVEAAGARLIHLDVNKSIPGLSRLFRLRQIIRDTRPEIIQSWLYQSDLIVGLFAGFSRPCPIIWGIRVQSVTGSSHDTLSTRAVIWACARLSGFIPYAIISNANVSRESHIGLGYASDRIVIIPNGIDTDIFQPDWHQGRRLRKELGISDNAPVIALVGRYDPQKNHDGFWPIVPGIIERFPDLQIILCGRGMTKDNAELTRMISAANAQCHTHFLGLRSDIPGILSCTDVLVSPSHEEGWPNVVGEAMACGTVCVTTDAGDSRDIVGNTGRVVARGDMAGLAEAVVDMLSLSEKDNLDMSSSARRRIVDRFDIGKVARMFRNLYSEALTNQKRTG